MTHRPTRVLMVYPRFASDSFWVYTPGRAKSWAPAIRRLRSE